MRASQRGENAESRRERERIREEKEMQRIMGATGNNPTPPTSSATGVKSISLTPKAGFKKLPATTAAGGGWKTVGPQPKKSVAELSWGNTGEDDYDPAYPTPV